MTSVEKVLNDLRKYKKGITFDRYATGFRLGARIFDLRELGYGIETITDKLPNGVKRARYVLVKDKANIIPITVK